MNEEITLKILILGDSQVGKTSLMLQYTEGFFPEGSVSTIGLDYKTKKIRINDVDFSLQIIDTAGQERFRSISKSIMNSVDGIVFLYDITDKKTFGNIKNWIKLAEESSNNDFKKIIVGNKIDLEKKREVGREALDKLCQNKKTIGEEISAKLGINIKEIFEKLTNLIIKDMTKSEIIKTFKENNGSKRLTKKKKMNMKKNAVDI